MKSNTKTLFIDIAAYLLGGIVYAIAIVAFIEPNLISPGGVTGIATILHEMFSLPTGVLVLVLNIPLFILGYLKFGFGFIWKTAIATAVCAVAIDVMALFIPVYTGDHILAALFGGVLIGVGLAIILLRGATTGGTDIAAKLIRSKYPHLSMGRLMLLLDTVIIISAAAVYRNIETALYSVITIYVSSKMIDGILYGSDRGKLIYIVTKHPERITDEIFHLVGRGVTMINAVGGYTRTERKMLFCAVRRQEAARIHALVKQTDPEAFLVITDAGEIIGEGFKGIDTN